MSPLPELHNPKSKKDLHEVQSTTYKPAYKEKQKNQLENLPPDLAQIVAVWQELPEHIKQAIRVLVDAAKQSNGND